MVIGTSAGVGMWILGTTGLVEGAERYALLFGVWTAFIEVIPYIGPWLSAVPPAIYALFVDPIGVVWVAAALPLHLPGRGAHRRPERDGERAPAAPAARHLRAARGRRAVRHPRRARGAADDGRHARHLGVLRRAHPFERWDESGTVPVEVELQARSRRSSRHGGQPLGLTQPTVPFHRGELPAHPPAPAAAHRRAARARARDAALARRRRDAALRLPGRGRRATGRRARPASRSCRSTRSRARAPSCSGSASGRCCSSASPRRRTSRARARGTTTASCSARSARFGPRHPGLTLLTDVCLCEYTSPRSLRRPP